jgi:AraC family ethanolamine operon transcriptional activator
LNRRFTQLLTRGAADPSLLGTPEGDRLEQECVRSIVAAMFSTATPQPELPLVARSRVFRRAEEFMRSHLGDPVGAIDLCRELKVSDRNLRRTFRERVGLGPMAYFKCLRLNAVRSRLRADPAVAVADASAAFGFHHAGNFAADYRRLFGERPSETARGG